jgi:hypothetical protein
MDRTICIASNWTEDGTVWGVNERELAENQKGIASGIKKFGNAKPNQSKSRSSLKASQRAAPRQSASI